MKKIMFFLMGGIVNYALKTGLTFSFTEFFGLEYYISYIIALVSVIIFSFHYNFHITFENKTQKRKKFIAYSISLFMFMAVDYSLVVLLTSYLRLHYLFSIVLITTLLLMVKYLVYVNFVFKEKEEATIGGNYYDKHNSKNPIARFLMKNFHETVFQFIEGINVSTMLDVGCGEGYTTMEIIKRFPHLKAKALEYDPATVNKANKLHPSLNVKAGDIMDIKEKTNAFDLVLSSEVLEHLKLPEKGISECRRVSKKYCIFTVPNEPFFRLANLVRLSYISRLGNTPGHVNNWTKKKLHVLLKKHFNSVSIKTSFLWSIALCKEQ